MAKFQEWTILQLSLFITFIISGLCINAVQALLYLLIGTWNKTLFRKLNYYLIWMIYAQVLFIADWWSGSEVRIFAKPEVLADLSGQSAIVVMNHHIELDWCYGWMVADRFGLLGNARVFVKKMLKYVPIVGWAWNFSDVAYLERNWDKDQEAMTKSVTSLSHYPDPVWLLVFAEGTRLSPEKLEASREFARKRGLPVLRHCLTPRTKGFVHVLQNVDRTKVRYVYDVTMQVNTREGGPATMSSILFGRKTVGECIVRRFDIASIPEDSEGASKFLMDLYADKDKLIDNYALTGSFFGNDSSVENEQDFKLAKLGPRPFSLINTIVLNFAVIPSVMGKIGAYAFSGSILYFFLSFMVVLGMYVALRKFIGLTKISKGSSYGKKSQ